MPEAFEVEISTRDGKPVPFVFARVTLCMPRKNHYNVLVGPADDHGRISVSRLKLEAEARKEMEFFIMDYADPAEATGEFFVAHVSAAETEAALRAHEQFSPYFSYRAGWREDLETAMHVLSGIDQGLTATILNVEESGPANSMQEPT